MARSCLVRVLVVGSHYFASSCMEGKPLSRSLCPDASNHMKSLSVLTDLQKAVSDAGCYCPSIRTALPYFLSNAGSRTCAPRKLESPIV